MTTIHKASKDYKDMVYNAHATMRDYYAYDQIAAMPIRDLLSNVNFFVPKLREIEKRRQNQQLEAELSGKKNMRRPGGLK